MADEDEEPRLLIRPLQFNDLPFLVALEQASFPPNEAATPEKITYRLHTCPELTLGIFEANDENDGSLLAMIHGTRTSSTYASDASMAIGGHEPHGSTVGLHTLCVHPGWRAKGLGTRILKEYLKRMESEKGVERVALIAHDELVPFYERVGFVNNGVSESQHGGVTWPMIALRSEVDFVTHRRIGLAVSRL